LVFASQTQSKAIGIKAEKHLGRYFKNPIKSDWYQGRETPRSPLQNQSKAIGNKAEKHFGLHFKTQSKVIGIKVEKYLGLHSKPNQK